MKGKKTKKIKIKSNFYYKCIWPIEWFIRRHKCFIFLLVTFIILFICVTVKESKEAARISANLLGGLEILEQEEFMRYFDSEESDIEGLSRYDKYMMGLDYHDGSDSDHDGLTDKEEIEVYGTNPLKSSTAGDMYSDSYKVENDIDTNTYIEYQGEISFEHNQCKEVELTADILEDMSAVVEDYTDRYSLTDFGISEVYKGYWIYNYSGTITIDTADIGAEEFAVYVCEGDFLAYGLSKLEKCKYIANGSKITLGYEFSNDRAYYVYITEPKNLFSRLAKTSGVYQLNQSKDNEEAYLVVGSPLFSNVTVYYPETSDSDKNSYYRERAKSIWNDDVKVEAMNIEGIRDKYGNLQRFLADFEITNPQEGYQWSDFPWYKAVFTYYYFSDEDNNYHTAFHPYVDELPFQNFASEYGRNGNCPGISYLTAYLFNTGTFPASGSYNGIEWYIGEDEANETLINAGLSDYKTRYFVDENSSKEDNYIGAGLTYGEQEFLKMIGAYGMKVNDTLPYLQEYMISNHWSNDWSVAENMMNYLNQGKILNVGLYLKNGTGHEINIYDYYYNESGELIFRVYDSNIPQSKVEDYSLNCEGACYLQCKKVLRSDGTYGMAYLYYPISGEVEYIASSDMSLMEQSSIIVADENLNVLN